MTFSGLGGGVPVTGTGSMSQIEGLLMLKATTPLGSASAFSLFGGLGAASLRPSGAPTGVGGPMFTSNATVPVFRAGIEVSQRAAMLNIALQAFYQRTGGATFETSLPGERFEEKPNDSVRLGLTFTYDSNNNFKNNNTFNVDDGKGDTPKTTTKPGGGEKKKDGPKEGGGGNPGQPMVAIDDCIVIIQCDPGQIPTPEQDPTSAQNADFDASAKLFKGAHIEHVTSKAGEHLDDILKKFKAQGCCTRIQIFGHGTPTGQLQLPYTIEKPTANDPADKLGGKQRENMDRDERKAWDGFTNGLKTALCQDPKATPKKPKPAANTKVKINACYSSTENGGTPIASELSFAGLNTSGWTGVCDFNDGTAPVMPQGHDAESKEKNHEAQEPEPKDEPKKGGKK